MIELTWQQQVGIGISVVLLFVMYLIILYIEYDKGRIRNQGLRRQLDLEYDIWRIDMIKNGFPPPPKRDANIDERRTEN